MFVLPAQRDDGQGRFWFRTIFDHAGQPGEFVFRLEVDKTIRGDVINLGALEAVGIVLFVVAVFAPQNLLAIGCIAKRPRLR